MPAGPPPPRPTSISAASKTDTFRFRPNATRDAAVAKEHLATVHHAMYWVGIAVLTANLALSSYRLTQYPNAYHRAFAPVVLAVLVACVFAATVAQLRRRDARPYLVAAIVVGGGVLAVHEIATRPSAPAYPPLLHAIGATVCISAVIGVRRSLILIPIAAAVIGHQRSDEIGVLAAGGEAMLLALSGAIVTTAANLLERSARTVSTAVAATHQLQADAHRAARRTFERELWNSLVHDKVLGALYLVIRARSDEVPQPARELAAEAEAAFRGNPVQDLDAARAWRRHASGLGLADDDIVCPGFVNDDEVQAALVGAGKEALTNVARHSGQRAVLIRGRLANSGATVTIADPGRGFDPAAAAARHGVRTSIGARLAAVGGTATIDSTPGGGTTVTLTWAPHADHSVQRASHWQMRTFAPLMIIGAIALVVPVFLGAPRWLDSHSVPLAGCVIAAIAGLTAVVSLARPSARRAWVVGGSVVAICLVQALNTPAGAGMDWRYWYVSALTPALGATSFRFPPRVGLLTAAASIAAIVAVDGATGGPLLGCVTGPAPVYLGTCVAGHFVRRALDTSWRHVSNSMADDLRLRREIAEQDERERELRIRVEALAATVAPTLRTIRAGGRFAAAERRALGVLDASVRDHMAAPALLIADLVQALFRARSQGSTVDLAVLTAAEDETGDANGDANGDGTEDEGETEGDELDTDGTAAHDRFQRLFCVALDAAPPGTRIRAVWRPSREAAPSTVSLVGEGLTSVAAALADCIARLGVAAEVTLTSDEDSVLLELARPSERRQ